MYSKESRLGPTHYIIPTFGHFQSLNIDQLQSPYNIFSRTNLDKKIILYRFEKVLCLPLKKLSEPRANPLRMRSHPRKGIF